MWTQSKTILFRLAIIIGMASVVTTIIYFTPIPEQEFMSCIRPCHELEMPMICRLKLTLEPYHTLTRSCSECPRNSTDCFRKHCISGDGVKRRLLTANRQIPGPNIHVCENDIMVVDVINRMPGHEVTMHWRGQPVTETPFMDGVAMLTQCPIPSGTTFQYKFRASRPGTHIWHAQSDGDIDGIVGALVVRQTESRNLQRDLYDVDDINHVVVVNLWHDKGVDDSLLINGRSQNKLEGGEFPPTEFTVIPGMRHRFRLANAGGRGNNCPIRIAADGHVFRVIALDGNPIVPRDTSAIELAEGERADIVLHANQPHSSYNLLASALCGAATHHGVAVVRYDAPDALVATSSNEVDDEVESLTTRTCRREKNGICLENVEALMKMPQELTGMMDNTLYLPYGYIPDGEFSDSLEYLSPRVPYMNNMTFIYPSSPLLTQPDDVNSDLLCSQNRRPGRCRETDLCECVHVVDIALYSTVEVVLVDEGGSDAAHVFHLHGHHFHVVGVTQMTHHVTVDKAKQLDQEGTLLTRNLNNPVVKDTLTVPNKGVAALRFKADNPGYWLLENDRAREINVVFHVGKPGDLPSIPEDFPTCGSWVGPDFFLI